MQIHLELAFDEGAVVRVLNFLADENAIIYRQLPETASVYDMNIRYKRERREEFADILNIGLKGWEDCDALAAARAGEIKARGAAALKRERGDAGWLLAQRMQLRELPNARVVVRTKKVPGTPGGLYHCIVKYNIAGRTFYDDPSARLGMFGYIDHYQPFVRPPQVVQRASRRRL